MLEALAVAPEEWRYGFSLSQETGLSSGTLYPLLKRLERGGYLEEQWLPPTIQGRPPRHVYRLTASGQSLTAEKLARASRSARKAAKAG